MLGDGEKHCAVGLNLRAGQLRVFMQHGLFNIIFSRSKDEPRTWDKEWTAPSEVGSWDVLTLGDGDDQNLVAFAGHGYLDRGKSLYFQWTSAHWGGDRLC